MDEIVDHLIISIFGSMIGILLGVGVVFGFREVTKGNIGRYFSNRYFVFIPWRTIALAILLFNHFPAYLLFLFFQ
jgi:ABC-type antimicrobial peptide transport system permease subunit